MFGMFSKKEIMDGETGSTLHELVRMGIDFLKGRFSFILLVAFDKRHEEMEKPTFDFFPPPPFLPDFRREFKAPCVSVVIEYLL